MQLVKGRPHCLSHERRPDDTLRTLLEAPTPAVLTTYRVAEAARPRRPASRRPPTGSNGTDPARWRRGAREDGRSWRPAAAAPGRSRRRSPLSSVGALESLGASARKVPASLRRPQRASPPRFLSAAASHEVRRRQPLENRVVSETAGVRAGNRRGPCWLVLAPTDNASGGSVPGCRGACGSQARLKWRCQHRVKTRRSPFA